MPRHSTNTCFLVHSQEKILLSLTLVRIGEMIQEMPFRMCFPHVLMAGRPQQILHGGTLKYLFGYIKIRIFYCSNRIFWGCTMEYLYMHWTSLDLCGVVYFSVTSSQIELRIYMSDWITSVQQIDTERQTDR